MQFAYDLHIHSALSPCSDDDMTPNNIVNMAQLKGLDFIAVTDHNCAENLEAVVECCRKSSIIAVPGMEVETSEEVHLLCYFQSLKMALEMQKHIYNSLPDIKNDVNIFGRQLIYDKKDNLLGEVDRMLLSASSKSTDNIFNIVKELEGIVIPAHVDRNSYSILSNLGIMPDYLNIKYIEFSKQCNIKSFLQSKPYLNHFNYIQSSDAHSLGHISERKHYIDLEEKKLESLFNYLLNV